MRRWPRAALATALLVATIAPATAAAAPHPTVVPASNRLYMISDSVGLGAIPQMKAAFGGSWQVTVDGKAGLFTESLVKYVKAAPAAAFGESAIVATGYNYPYWDSARFAASVDQMVAALTARGVTRIYWVTLREVKPAYYSHWAGLTAPYRTLYLAYPRANQQLRDALGRHPNLSLVDWASLADRTGITYDAIHLNPAGASQYAALARNTVVTGRTRSPAGTVRTVQFAGVRGVPADAAAVALNVSVVNPRTEGSLSVYACDLVGAGRPITLWYRPGQSVAGGTLVPLGPSGTVCVVPSSAAPGGGALTGPAPAGGGGPPPPPAWGPPPRGPPTVPAGTISKVRISAAPGAPTPPFTALVGLTESTSATGEVRVYTCGTAPPAAATRTFEPGVAQSVAQLVRTDANGDICVKSTAPSRFALSLLTAFGPGADIHPLATRRLLDTRTGTALPANTNRAVTLPTGIAGWFSLGLLSPAAQGTATLFPCAAGPSGSSWVYVVPHHSQSNAAMLAVDGTHRVCVRSTVATHVTIDVGGWISSAFQALTPIRVLNTLP